MVSSAFIATAETVRTPHPFLENKPPRERGWGEGRLANQNILTVRLTAMSFKR